MTNTGYRCSFLKKIYNNYFSYNLTTVRNHSVLRIFFINVKQNGVLLVLTWFPAPLLTEMLDESHNPCTVTLNHLEGMHPHC